ncbi:hypothetical protein BurJ1DRAFT_1387 [Burkholderiales bacterium JOSHI_001]|nr:hypothetical protein BurJ1DRAFT_1387 [Burkholderiales bacterium JOSHI_001]
MRTILALAVLLAATTAQAHGGHGLNAPHLHGWDLLALGVAVAAALVVVSRRR